MTSRDRKRWSLTWGVVTFLLAFASGFLWYLAVVWHSEQHGFVAFLVSVAALTAAVNSYMLWPVANACPCGTMGCRTGRAS